MNDRKQRFSVEKTAIDGLAVIYPFFVEDERGFFVKNFERDIFRTFGLENEIQEEFTSRSKKNVVRGLHFQTREPQVKIVSVAAGRIFDVAVDLRRGSATFGQYESRELSDENHEIFYIPRGFAHGFLVLSDFAVVSYMCVGKYFGEYDTGIVWDDPDIAIGWPVQNKEDIIVSPRDRALMRFAGFEGISV